MGEPLWTTPNNYLCWRWVIGASSWQIIRLRDCGLIPPICNVSQEIRGIFQISHHSLVVQHSHLDTMQTQDQTNLVFADLYNELNDQSAAFCSMFLINPHQIFSSVWQQAEHSVSPVIIPVFCSIIRARRFSEIVRNSESQEKYLKVQQHHSTTTITLTL